MVQKIIKRIRSRKNICYLLITILFFLLFTSFTFAQDAIGSRQYGVADCTWINLTEATSGGVLTKNARSSLCNLQAGVVPDLCDQKADLCNKLRQNNIDPKSYVDGGALGFMVQVAQYTTDGATRNGPDAVTFVAQKINPNVVNAQSSALQGLSPILVLWGTLRNFAYILIAIALVISGISIYFNNKVGGKQDNVSIVTHVIDIITTLVTISLSYLVAGIAVDLIINVGNAAIAAAFNPFINSSSILNNLYSNGSGVNIMTILADFQGAGTSTSVINLLQQGLQNLGMPLNNTQTFFNSLGYQIGGPVGGFVFNATAGSLIAVIFNIARGVVSTAINPPLLTAIISFTIFIIIFRVIFLLLSQFVAIVLQIGFAPLILISGAFPGISAITVFTNWMKRIISAAIVFPIVFAMMLLSAIFLNLSYNSPDATSASNSSCVYDNSIQNPVTITGNGIIQNFDSGGAPTNQSTFKSNIFNSTRFNNPDNPVPNDPYSGIRKCFPIMLPPKFNWLPAPIGNLGNGFEIDDFTRFVIGIALIVLIPSISKTIQDALKTKSQQGGGIQDALAGAGLFNTFVQQVPLIGKPISQITSSITGAIK